MPFDIDPTVSSLQRADECPGSFALAHVDETGEDAIRGDVIHGFSRRVLSGTPRERAIIDVPDEYQAVCREIDFEAMTRGMTDVRCEVAFAWDTETREARELGVDLRRDYPARPLHVIPGAIDLHGRRVLDGKPVVRDIKTGRYVGQVKDHWQTRFHAAAAAYVAGEDSCEGGIAYVHSDGSVHVDPYVFSAYELDAVPDDLADVVAGVREARAVYAETGRVHVASGEWCKYCPALSACPAHVALARAMLPELDAIADQILALTPEQGAIAWQKAKTIEGILENVFDGLKMLVRRYGKLPIQDGKSVRASSFLRTSFSQSDALVMLRRKGATEEEIQALYRAKEVEQIRIMNDPGSTRAKPKKRVKAA